MGFEGLQTHTEDPRLAFEAAATDFGNNISMLSQLIGAHSEVPPDAKAALDTLWAKLDTYAPAN